MKTKKFNKKLILNKKSIATLSNNEKDEAKGGLKWQCSEVMGPCDTEVKPSGCDYSSFTVCYC